jgi:hypothetical protein
VESHRTGVDLEIVRGDLCEVLIEQARDVDVVFGDVIESIVDTKDGIESDVPVTPTHSRSSWSSVLAA